MPYKDKEKQAAAARRHYDRNKEKMKTRAMTRNREQRILLAGISAETRQVPCADCDQEFAYYVMDFDHVRGEKRADISKLVNQGVSVQTLLDEIAKCDVICSNCHRVRTFTRIGACGEKAYVLRYKSRPGETVPR